MSKIFRYILGILVLIALVWFVQKLFFIVFVPFGTLVLVLVVALIVMVVLFKL
jgi:hypothetical protein